MFLQILEEVSTNEELYNHVSQELQRQVYMQYISYTVAILTILGICLFIKFRNKDREVGRKGVGISSFLTTMTKIALVGFVIMTWFGNYEMGISTQIYLLGIPFALIFAAQSDGIFNAIKFFITGLIFGTILLIGVQVLRILGLGNDTIYLIEKVLSTAIAGLTLTCVDDYGYKGWIRESIPMSDTKINYKDTNSENSRYSGSYNRSSSYSSSYGQSNNYSSSYSGYSNYSSSTSNPPDLFGANTKVEYDYFTGDTKYYQNGRLIASGKKDYLLGGENIYDTNGNKIYTKEKGIFDDYVYKDNNRNTVYKEREDFLWGSSVYDKNNNKVAEHDPIDDIFSTGRNYTSNKF